MGDTGWRESALKAAAAEAPVRAPWDLSQGGGSGKVRPIWEILRSSVNRDL